MSTDVIAGTVRNGVVVPCTPLPEGADVEIHLLSPAPGIPPDLQEELQAWQRAHEKAYDLVDSMTKDGAEHAQG